MPAEPAIVLTDFSSDVGDLGAVAVALALHRAGYLDLKAITVDTTNAHAAGAISAVCSAFGLSLPIGTWKGSAFDPFGPGAWVQHLFDNYPRTLGLASTVPDGLEIQRQALLAAQDRSLVVITLGTLNALNLLWTTYPTLVSQKVKRLVVMGGRYPDPLQSEWNLVQAPADAANIAATWPTPIIYVGYEVGLPIIAGGTLATALPVNDIVRVGYAQSGYGSGREAWDEMSLLVAVQGTGGFRFVPGTNFVNSGSGLNTFRPAPGGKDCYVIKTEPDATYQARLNTLLTAPRTGRITAWPSNCAVVRFD